MSLSRADLLDMGFTIKEGYYNKGAFYLLPISDGVGFMVYVAMSDQTHKVKWEQVNTADKLVMMFNKFHVFK